MALITKTDAEALIPEGEVREIFKAVAEGSTALKLLTRLPNMTSNKTRIKVEEVLPLVYWQSNDTAHKKTTKAKWANKYIYAEELAVIIPISEATLADAEYDIWGEIRPKIVEAIGAKIDAAVLVGTGKPTSFPEGLINTALTNGYAVTPASGQTFYSQVSDAMGLVEDAGYEVNGIVGGASIKKYFRDMTDTTGQLIVGSEINDLPRYAVKNGAFDTSKAKVLVGDFKQGVYAVRQDITYKLLTEGVIQDTDGSILYNLGQQDMVALRVVFRFGWQLPNPVNPLKPDEEDRYPFAVVKPATSSAQEEE